MEARWLALLLALATLAALAPPAQPWGNGSFVAAEFRHYGVHDAIAELALEKLHGYSPSAARWLMHWFVPEPGGYGGGFGLLHDAPTRHDNFLAYTDDPDSVLQDWPNHHYYVHPRPGFEDRGAAPRSAELLAGMRQNLTLWLALGQPPCSAPEHMAAYGAGLLAHYVGDVGQFGHTDHTLLDHRHPREDPEDRTYHGYYESASWGPEGLRALLADQRARPWAPRLVRDAAAEVAALAVRVNMPDGKAVAFLDANGVRVMVGSGYAAMLTGFVEAYDAREVWLGMRGYTPELWARTMSNVEGSVAFLADLYWTAWLEARATAPPVPRLPWPAPDGCPAA